MKTKYFIVFIVFCLMTIRIVGCNDSKNIKANSNITAKNSNKTILNAPKNEKSMITFIELGSVNCIPCKMMQPVMKYLEEKYKNKMKVVFHDVWTEKGKPFGQKYKIKLIPTQIFLDKDGKEFFRHEGFFAKKDIIKMLKEHGIE